MRYRLSGSAKERIDRVLDESARHYGAEAAERYGDLIMAAIRAVAEDPARAGVRPVPEQPALRAYPIRLARARVQRGRRVGRPRHLLIFRLATDGVVEVLGLVHDRMVLSRAAERLADEAEGA